MSIQSPTKYEICYLILKGKTPVQAYNEVKTAYGDKAMNHTSVFKLCGDFKNGRISVHDDEEPKTFNCDRQNCGKNRKCTP